MNSSRLLDRVRAVDLSQYIPGPFATRQLADLGADVIKVEPPQGDPMRYFMHSGDGDVSPIYRHVNRGKRVVRLDLKSAAGRSALEGLLAGADILLESYRPGVLARLGFERKRLAQINPRLIHCALSGYGQTGPDALRAGHDVNYCALSSQAIVSGTAAAPVIGYPPIADHAASLQAAVAMLAALHARGSRAGGTFLDISVTESILSWQYLPIFFRDDGRAESLLGGGAACYNIYRCADGAFVSLGALEAPFWENFCAALDRPEWVARQHEPLPQTALIAEVAAAIAAEPAVYWQRKLDGVDCCFAPLLEPAQLAADPQLAARHAISPSGPTYPAWIDDAPVEVEDTIVEIDAADALQWK